MLHNLNVLHKYKRFIVGEVQGGLRTKKKKENEFGDLVPYGDPYWYQGFKSPFYNDSHIKFRAKVRAFVDKEMKPYCSEYDEKGNYPADLPAKAYAAGILSAVWPKEYGGTPPEGAKVLLRRFKALCHHLIPINLWVSIEW